MSYSTLLGKCNFFVTSMTHCFVANKITGNRVSVEAGQALIRHVETVQMICVSAFTNGFYDVAHNHNYHADLMVGNYLFSLWNSNSKYMLVH